MTIFQVPAAEEQPEKLPQFEFTFKGSTAKYKMPNAGEVLDIDKTIELAMMPAEQQMAAVIAMFLKTMPEAARKKIRGKEQIRVLVQAWQKHGNGVSVGEA